MMDTPGSSTNIVSGSALVGSSSGPGLSAIQELIISTLNIPLHLTDCSAKAKADIRMAYAKYLALLDAIKSMSKMVTSGTWTYKTVTNDDIIEIFMSKSAYFKNHAKVFPMVNRYPMMERWLSNGDDSPSDYDVWGYQRHTFDVLRSILSALPADAKVKGKAKSDSSSPPAEQRRRKVVARTVNKKGKQRADDRKKGDSKRGSPSKTRHAHT